MNQFNVFSCSAWRTFGKVTAVLAALAVVVGLGIWLDLGRAQAQSTVFACPTGLEQNGALCYPTCQEGFFGDGPLCLKNCPDGFTYDTGFCFKPAHLYATASYGRGAGVGMVCGQNQEQQGGLCYPKCRSTHYGVGPVCWQRCPAGYADHGATCYRHIFDFFFKNTYGRGAGAPVSTCAAGLERNGALCYPKCSAGYVGNGPLCLQKCPVGYVLDSGLCRKDAVVFITESYGRGAGEVLNAVPTAVDEKVTTPLDTAVALEFAHQDFNDDTEKPVIVVQHPAHGTYSEKSYTPNTGFQGADTMLWKTTDGKNESNVAVVTILVGDVGQNAAPVALDRTIEVTEDQPITITVTCTDADNDDLFYQLVTRPSHGAYEWRAPNTVIYTPTADFVGTDAFTFRSHDGQDFSNVSTITLTVVAANDAPLALAQTITTTHNANAAVLLTATDVESDTIAYSLVTSPTHGVLSGAAPDLVYTPARDFVGADSFIFQAEDALGASTTATIALTVLAANAAPVATSQHVTTTAESDVALFLAASDADGDELTFAVVAQPLHGAVTGDGAEWIYTPGAGFIGADSLAFTAADSLGVSTPATVTLEVLPAPALGSVAGLVIDDRNGNGQADADETGASGLRITLTSQARAAGNGGVDFAATTDAIGAWRFDAAPFGQYTLRIESGPGAQIAAPLTGTVTVTQRGVQQSQPVAVTVTGRAIFLPVVTR